MHSTTIKIDGSKLRALLESKTGKTIYQIAQESGYSKNVISNAIKKGYASSAVQNIARLYDIAPADYQILEVKHTEPELKGQISIDDLESIKKDDLKAIIKESYKEVLSEALQAFHFGYEPKYKRFVLYINEEDLLCKRQ